MEVSTISLLIAESPAHLNARRICARAVHASGMHFVGGVLHNSNHSWGSASSRLVVHDQASQPFF